MKLNDIKQQEQQFLQKKLELAEKSKYSGEPSISLSEAREMLKEKYKNAKIHDRIR